MSFPKDAKHPVDIANWIMDAMESIADPMVANIAAELVRKVMEDEQLQVIRRLNDAGDHAHTLEEYREAIRRTASENGMDSHKAPCELEPRE